MTQSKPGIASINVTDFVGAQISWWKGQTNLKWQAVSGVLYCFVDVTNIVFSLEHLFKTAGGLDLCFREVLRYRCYLLHHQHCLTPSLLLLTPFPFSTRAGLDLCFKQCGRLWNTFSQFDCHFVFTHGGRAIPRGERWYAAVAAIIVVSPTSSHRFTLLQWRFPNAKCCQYVAFASSILAEYAFKANFLGPKAFFFQEEPLSSRYIFVHLFMG